MTWHHLNVPGRGGRKWERERAREKVDRAGGDFWETSVGLELNHSDYTLFFLIFESITKDLTEKLNTAEWQTELVSLNSMNQGKMHNLFYFSDPVIKTI